MMILDVRKLNAARQYTGTLRFTVEPDQEWVTLPSAKIVAPVQVEGEYEIFEDDSVQVKGKVRFLLHGACSRCLKETEKWIEADWDPCFTKGESDGETYSYEKGVVILDESVNDTVMLNMPYTLLCDENCEGIDYHQSEEK